MTIHASLAKEDWDKTGDDKIDVDSLCSKVDTQGLLPSTIRSNIAEPVVTSEVSSLKLLRIFIVIGGIARDRKAKAQELAGEWWMSSLKGSKEETAIASCKDDTGYDNFQRTSWNKLHALARLGSLMQGYPVARVKLPCPFREDMMTYSRSDDAIHIKLHRSSTKLGPGCLSVMKKKATRSLVWLLEISSGTECTLQFCNSLDAGSIPSLPHSVKTLTLQDMDNFSKSHIPLKHEADEQHWIHSFLHQFEALKNLVLLDCGYREHDMRRLKQEWLPKLNVSVLGNKTVLT